MLISPVSTSSNEVVIFSADGGPDILRSNIVNRNNSEFAKNDAPQVYPTLYLKKEVKITSGDGSSSNPYTLDIE